MSGFFGVASKNDCVMDLFFGVDYHSHLGTRRGGMAVYGKEGFNRSIQKDLSKKGIKVTGFYPGFMQTNIFKKAGNDYDTSTGLETEKVAKAIEFIISCDDDVIIPEFGIKDIENY